MYGSSVLFFQFSKIQLTASTGGHVSSSEGSKCVFGHGSDPDPAAGES